MLRHCVHLRIPVGDSTFHVLPTLIHYLVDDAVSLTARDGEVLEDVLWILSRHYFSILPIDGASAASPAPDLYPEERKMYHGHLLSCHFDVRERKASYELMVPREEKGAYESLQMAPLMLHVHVRDKRAHAARQRQRIREAKAKLLLMSPPKQ